MGLCRPPVDTSWLLELAAAARVSLERDKAAAVLFESDARVLGETFRIGMESSQEALNLAPNLLVPGQPLVAHPSLTPLGLHFQHTPAPRGTPTHGKAGGTRRFCRC